MFFTKDSFTVIIISCNFPIIGLMTTVIEVVREIIIEDLAMKGCVELTTVLQKEKIGLSVSSVDH